MGSIAQIIKFFRVRNKIFILPEIFLNVRGRIENSIEDLAHAPSST
jgi:hypothetical protein